MKLALKEAEAAFSKGEVPVGAIVARGGEVLSSAHNEVEALSDASAHAEVLALRRAAEKIGDWRLSGLSLYVTLEPCTMCTGAIKLSRVEKVVFGATDQKMGALGSLFDLGQDPRVGPVPKVIENIYSEESIELLQRFFKSKR